VRWRRIDLQRLIAERFGVAFHERTVGKILHQLGFSHISARAIRLRTSGSWRSLRKLPQRAERSPR
jgi:transposase